MLFIDFVIYLLLINEALVAGLYLNTPPLINNELSGLTGLTPAPKQNAIGKGDGFGFPN